MEGFAGKGDGFAGLAAKVRDIDGKLKLKSCLKTADGNGNGVKGLKDKKNSGGLNTGSELGSDSSIHGDSLPSDEIPAYGVKGMESVNDGKDDVHSKYKINFDKNGIPTFNFDNLGGARVYQEKRDTSSYNMEFPDGLSSSKVPGASSSVHGEESGLHGIVDEAKHGLMSYASMVNKDKSMKPVAFRSLQNDACVEGTDVVLPLSSIKEVAAKFDNTLYGYFIGKRLAYPIVEQFARNAWKKFGFVRSMMNGKGFFFFQFDSKVGMDRVLEEGRG